MRTSPAAQMHLRLSILGALATCFCFLFAAQESGFQNAVGVSDDDTSHASRQTVDPIPSSLSSSSLSLNQEDADRSSLRRSLRKQIGDCKGTKFQIVIHFDSYPEDFSMQLVNDDKNKTVWDLDDPNHTYADPKFQHKTVAAGVCLPREWCWVLTVYDRNGDGMVGKDLATPGNGGGFRLLLNNMTVNYYTGKHNGCYKKLWFRFGEWCSAQDEFGYEPGDSQAEGCGNFTEGRAPDDGWFKGDLYQVGTPKPTTLMPTRAPVPSKPVARPPVRIGTTDRPVGTPAPVRVDPAKKPVRITGAPIRVGPTDRPGSHPVTQPKPVPRPTKPVPTPEPAPTPQQQPVNPIFCHFRYC